MAPPPENPSARRQPGVGGSGSAGLKSKRQSDSEPSPFAQAIIDATERAEDLLALWREHRRLAHRVRLARLKFELIGLDPAEKDAIADEVAEWGRLVKAFAPARAVDLDHEEGGRHEHL